MDDGPRNSLGMDIPSGLMPASSSVGDATPRAGWGGGSLWPAQSGYTRNAPALVHRGWVYGAQAIQTRPLGAPVCSIGWVFNITVPLGLIPLENRGLAGVGAVFEARMLCGVKQG